MNPLFQFVALLGVHFIADFVLQSHWMASNKSKRFDALFVHVAIYTIVLAMASPLIFPPFTYSAAALCVAFALINGALHLATDFITSRMTARLWAEQRWHD